MEISATICPALYVILSSHPCRFKNKYHPIESKNLAKEKRQAVKKRLRIFIELLDTGYMDNVSLDDHYSDSVMKILDTGN